MQDFIQQINDLADQLSSLSLESVSDEEKAIVLTRGVHKSYSNIVVALQETDKIENYEHVVSSLINAETRRIEKGEINPTKHDEKAFYTNQRGNRGQRGRSNNNRGRGQSTNANSNHQTNQKFEGNCRFCGIKGHMEYQCRRKQQQQGFHQDNNN